MGLLYKCISFMYIENHYIVASQIKPCPCVLPLVSKHVLTNSHTFLKSDVNMACVCANIGRLHSLDDQNRRNWTFNLIHIGRCTRNYIVSSHLPVRILTTSTNNPQFCSLCNLYSLVCYIFSIMEYQCGVSWYYCIQFKGVLIVTVRN